MRIALISRRTLMSQPGGDTVHVQQTAKYLLKAGHDTRIISAGTRINAKDYDLLHFFNLGRPADFLPYLSCGLPYVISSIYVDYSVEIPFLKGWRKALAKMVGSHGMEYLKTLGRGLLGRDNFPHWRYCFGGQKAAVKVLLQKAAFLVTATEAEAEIIKRAFGTLPEVKVIPLGLEHCSTHLPKGALPPRQGVLCVARFEPLKNQLNLIKAANQLKTELTLVGSASAAHQWYYEACRQMAGAQVHFAGKVPPQQLPQYYARHAVHVLPSRYETTGLSSLEALAQGCNIVVSDTPIQREIFGNQAIFCDPQNADSIREALQRALAASAPGESSRNWALQHFSWERAAGNLIALYRQMV